MAGQDDGDGTNLLDDSFDDLPVDELNALEQNAVLHSTQQAASRLNGDPPQHTLQTLTTLPFGPSFFDHASTETLRPQPDPPSSDYGNLDEDGFAAQLIDAVDPSATVVEEHVTLEAKLAGQATQREQWRLERFADRPSHADGKQGRAQHQDFVRNEVQPAPPGLSEKQDDVMTESVQAQLQEVGPKPSCACRLPEC